jgi:DNA-binding CsgD family transcriptional regulator
MFTNAKDEILTAKNYASYFGVSIRTAEKYLTNDKKQLGLHRSQKLRVSHFIRLYGSITYNYA